MERIECSTLCVASILGEGLNCDQAIKKQRHPELDSGSIHLIRPTLIDSVSWHGMTKKQSFPLQGARGSAVLGGVLC